MVERLDPRFGFRFPAEFIRDVHNRTVEALGNRVFGCGGFGLLTDFDESGWWQSVVPRHGYGGASPCD